MVSWINGGSSGRSTVCVLLCHPLRSAHPSMYPSMGSPVRACVRRRRYVRWYGGQGLCGVETEWRVFESVLGSYHHLPPLFFIC
jgi:hypothetical protein